jgi:hypothetical protein
MPILPKSKRRSPVGRCDRILAVGAVSLTSALVVACLCIDFERKVPFAHSGASRSVIPAEADHRFRSKPITDSGASRSPIPLQADRFQGSPPAGA